jgi:hypothetical protein
MQALGQGVEIGAGDGHRGPPLRPPAGTRRPTIAPRSSGMPPGRC